LLASIKATLEFGGWVARGIQRMNGFGETNENTPAIAHRHVAARCIWNRVFLSNRCSIRWTLDAEKVPVAYATTSDHVWTTLKPVIETEISTAPG
jgi:hypothetical protein